MGVLGAKGSWPHPNLLTFGLASYTPRRRPGNLLVRPPSAREMSKNPHQREERETGGSSSNSYRGEGGDTDNTGAGRLGRSPTFGR